MITSHLVQENKHFKLCLFLTFYVFLYHVFVFGFEMQRYGKISILEKKFRNKAEG